MRACDACDSVTMHLICAGEDRLRESGLPYCIVRPGRFVDKPAGSEAKLKAGKPFSHRHSGRAMVPAVAKRGQRKLLHTRRCVTFPGMKTDAPAANVDACCPSHACCCAHSAGRHSRPLLDGEPSSMPGARRPGRHDKRQHLSGGRRGHLRRGAAGSKRRRRHL